MPRWTGFSHAAAALTVLLVSPLIKRMVEILVRTRNIRTTVQSAATTINTHPLIPLTENLIATALYVVIICALAFVWGYAYHVRRHTA